MNPLIGGSLIGAGIGGLSNIASNVFNAIQAKKTRDFNREEAEKNREFQKNMRDTSLISSVNQAKELGISPSLVLGQGSTALGGSSANVSGGQARAKTSGINSAVNSVLQALTENYKMKTLEEMNEDKLQAIQNLKSNNSVTSKKNFNYNNLYDNIDDLIKKIK